MANPLLVSSVALSFRFLTLFKMHPFIPNFIGNLQKTDKILQLDQNQFKRDHVFIAIFIMVVILMSVPFQLYSDFPINTNHFSDYLFLINSYNNFTATCVEFQFITLCYLVYARFKVINTKLVLYQETIGDKNFAKNTHKSVRVANLTICKQIDMLSTVGLLGEADEKVINEIKILRNIYRVLCEACDDLGHHFSTKLVISLFSCIVNVLLNFYFAIFGGYKSAPSTRQSVPSLINDVIWGLYYFQRFVWICLAAHVIIKEGTKTRIKICNVMGRKWEKIIKDELKTFLYYAMNKELKFVPCGFFRLDLTLITAAVATGTTYLVILAQFHKGC